MRPLRTLIVDDSSLARKFIKDALSSLNEVEVVGMVSNGRDALLRVETLKPDIVTLDIEMPGMSGIEVLSLLQKSNFLGAVVMLSSLTEQGAPLTIQALELGAFDFILKPSFSSIEKNIAALQEMFLPIAKAVCHRDEINRLLKVDSFHVKSSEQKTVTSSSSSILSAAPNEYALKNPSEIVAIGVSTGGPKALSQIIPHLSVKLQVPVVIIQHMPQGFTKEFAKSLNTKSSITVKEAEDGEVLQSGTVYIAPGGRHIKVIKIASRIIFRETDDPPENNCRPSVDYFFRSVAEIYGGSSTAVVLTGMGQDGVEGARLMKNRGARVIVQDKKTSVVFGMPQAVIEAGLEDIVCPLNTIAYELSRNLRG